MKPIDPYVNDFFTRSSSSKIEDVVARRLSQFFESRTLGPAIDLGALAASFAAARLPERAVDAGEYFEELFEHVVAHAVRTQNARFAGHMTSALPNFVVPLAKVIAELNQNVVKFETSGAFTFLERQVLAMLHQLVFSCDDPFYADHGLARESTLGAFTSGGTVANLSALWCARNRRLGRKAGFPGLESEGLAAGLEAHGFRRAVVIGSSLAHYSLVKACDLLGFGSSGLIRIPAHNDGRIDVDALRRQLDDCDRSRVCVIALVGIAGSTETGSVDPLKELAAEAAARGIHFHVDAAWGGPVLFSQEYRGRLAGIESADTVTIDGHKQLYLPMGVGMVLFRDPRLATAIEKTANYIVRSGSVDLGRRSVEGSRPAHALYVHAALHILGRAGYQELIDAGISRAAHVARSLDQRHEFELLEKPQLNIVVYRYVPRRLRDLIRTGRSPCDTDALAMNAVNERIQEVQFRTGSAFASRTSLYHTRHGASVPVVCLRLVLANPLTTERDLDALLDEQNLLGERIEREQLR